MKRSRFPYILGTSLLVLTIGASFLGFFAYTNLNQIIGTLEDEAKPRVNLLLLNNISMELQKVEYAMERYVYTNEERHMIEFRESIASSVQILDTLKKQNNEPIILNSLDSLQDLILNKGTILSQVADLDYESMEETFANLKLQLNDIQTKTILEDTLLRKKRGFLQNLFGKKEEVISSDTIDIYGSDEYQNIINSQLDSIASRSQRQAYTQKLKEFTLQQDHQDIQARITALLATMEKWEIDRIRSQATNAQGIARHTNKYVTMFSVAVPLLLLITFTVLIIYIMRTKKHQEALDSSRKNALKLAKEKEQFLANMSHEIRTPMNAISGFAKILLKGNLNEEQYDYIRIIDKSTKHLTHILNDVLDFSKLQSGKIKLESKPFNPTELLEDTLRLVEDKAEEKNLRLEFETQDLPEIVVGDPYRLRQILLNLVYNGIKFTEKGGVYVSARKEKSSKGGVRLAFEVMDTGIGIPLNRQKHIFNEFEQVNREDKRKGTGLGLSITKKLVSIHRGKIKVDSEEGRGTTFKVELPYRLSDQAPAEDISNSEEPVLQKMHILIADDEEFNRKLLMAIFKEHDISYDIAVDGAEAYELMSTTDYDVILMDFRMPKMTGPQVAEKIRSELNKNHTTPIIGLTATVSDHDMKMAKESGISEVLRKPFDTDELLNIIKNSYTLDEQASNTPSPQPFDLKSLKNMGDDEFVKDMVETFISSTKENLRELDKCYNQKDWQQTAEVLHKIIAPARHLKAESLVKILKSHELEARDGKAISSLEYEKIKSSIQALVDSLQLHLHQKNQ
ncbi:Signal transduction histidine kinase [Ekhidna lutea]|uniref:histidine kinase n=1 Tax=Ekhidna lutea TaxID=447679 RepID=A0A239KH32_EKHLU|nr:ATP-binding protein [Ekhidna lutea]SNT16998.1 Signal transduction histidine kinase [Ekhidna lutea]